MTKPYCIAKFKKKDSKLTCTHIDGGKSISEDPTSQPTENDYRVMCLSKVDSYGQEYFDISIKKSGEGEVSFGDIYQVLLYLKENGFALERMNIITKKDPQEQFISCTSLGITKSRKVLYYSTKAEVLFGSMYNALAKVLMSTYSAIKDHRFLQVHFLIKDLIMGSNLTTERKKLAQDFSAETMALKGAIDNNGQYLVTGDNTKFKVSDARNKLNAIVERYEGLNNKLSTDHDKKEGSGTLARKFAQFKEELPPVSG